MKRHIAIRLCLFLCGTMFLTTSCSNSDDGNKATESDQITTLADLKALFDKGEVTHIDFKTKENRELLDEEIETIVIVPKTDIFDFKLMQIVTKSPPLSENTPDHLRQRNTTSLTFEDEIVNKDPKLSTWVVTATEINGVEVESFTPHAFLFDSEINTATLSLLGDKLQMKFKKK